MINDRKERRKNILFPSVLLVGIYSAIKFASDGFNHQRFDEVTICQNNDKAEYFPPAAGDQAFVDSISTI